MKPSFVLKHFFWRTFFQSLFFSTLLFAIVAYFYWQSQDLGTPLNVLDVASLCVFLILFGILQWMFQKNTLSKLVANQPVSSEGKRPSTLTPPTIKADPEKRQREDKRLFVHLFSILQREGRLLDFFQEDLSQYEDVQIGAAVRSIHANCRRTVSRYLSPEPIMPQAEGETVEIAVGFDRHAVILVGNVVGEPPFKGILRHRGWQLRSISLPKLSEAENPNLIAPAEVEIP